MGFDVWALVDCGAGVNLISARMLDRLRVFADNSQCSVEPGILQVQVANGGAWNLTQCARVCYKIGGTPFCQKFLGSSGFDG